MPYIIEVVQAGRTVEVMKYYSSRYGKKGIKRGERKALTKEEQIKVNKRAAEKKLRRLINENFQEGDTHLVLDYRKERRPAGRKQMREAPRYPVQVHSCNGDREERGTASSLSHKYARRDKPASYSTVLEGKRKDTPQPTRRYRTVR